MTSRLGHVQREFERVTGQSVVAWLEQNASTMTVQAASEAIGYASCTALRTWLARNMPDLKFRAVRAAFEPEQAAEAIGLHSQGATWRALAVRYGHPARDAEKLREQCRRLSKRSG